MNKTSSSADADKPARLAWRSVKAAEHSTVPYVRYNSLLCNSNFVFKTRRFHDIRLQKSSWHRNGGQKSLNVIDSHISLDTLCLVSYLCSLVTLSLKCTALEIIYFINAVTLKTGLGVCRGHWKCHHSIERVYDFLFTFYSNYGSISRRFWDIQCRKIVTLKYGYGSKVIQCHWKWYHSIDWI